MPLQLFGRDQIHVHYEERLSHELSDRLRGTMTSFLEEETRLIDRVRRYKVFNVTIIHWFVLVTWVVLLLRFTGIYRSLYSNSALLATMCTNVLLFGISDCLAQIISCVMAYQVDPVPNVLEKAMKNITSRFIFDSIEESELEDDSASVFNDYGPHGLVSARDPERADLTSSNLDVVRDNAKTHEIFHFYRWVCFMFWGWFLSFFQVPWYKFLNFFFTKDPTVIQVFERVLSDQLLYSPVSLYCFFMYSSYIMERGDYDSFQIKIRKIYLSTLGCNYLVWPLVQFINFLAVPKHLQVPFSSSVGVIWNCFLSMRSSSNS